MQRYWVYMLRCVDESYYVGVTSDVERRLVEHCNGDLSEGAYVYKRLPFALVYQRSFSYVLDAIAWEKRVKRWTRGKKEALIRGDQDALESLASRRGGRPR